MLQLECHSIGSGALSSIQFSQLYIDKLGLYNWIKFIISNVYTKYLIAFFTLIKLASFY